TRRWVHLAHPRVVAWVGVIRIVSAASLTAQGRASSRPDLSGRWRLNPELSENAESKLQGMQAQSGGHMGLGGLFGGLQKQIDEAPGLLLRAADWLLFA